MSLQAIYNPTLGDAPLLIRPNIIEVTLYAGARETLHQAYPAIPSVDIAQTCQVYNIPEPLIGLVSELSYTVENLLSSSPQDATYIVSAISRPNTHSRYRDCYMDTCRQHLFSLQKVYRHSSSHEAKEKAFEKKEQIRKYICEARDFRKNHAYLHDLAEAVSRMDGPIPL